MRVCKVSVEKESLLGVRHVQLVSARIEYGTSLVQMVL